MFGEKSILRLVLYLYAKLIKQSQQYQKRNNILADVTIGWGVMFC